MGRWPWPARFWPSLRRPAQPRAQRGEGRGGGARGRGALIRGRNLTRAVGGGAVSRGVVCGWSLALDRGRRNRSHEVAAREARDQAAERLIGKLRILLDQGPRPVGDRMGARSLWLAALALARDAPALGAQAHFDRGRQGARGRPAGGIGRTVAPLGA